MSKKTRDENYDSYAELRRLMTDNGFSKSHDDRNRDDGRNNHDNHNDDRNRQQNNNQQNFNPNNNNNQNDRPRNPVCKILNNNDGRVFTREKVLNMLVDEDGLGIMIKDLKAAKKNPDKVDTHYIQKLLTDVVFASALVEAMEQTFGKKFSESEFSRKDISLLMGEIYNSLYRFFNNKGSLPYDSEIIDSMKDSYRDILYRFNKKKVEKLCDDVKGMSKNVAKQIVVVTSGGNAVSVYRLLDFIYKNADSEDFFSTSQKSLLKLFKICYGKNNIGNTIKNIMLEHRVDTSNMSEQAIDAYSNIDMLIREYLNSCEREEAKDILFSYAAERKRQEGNSPSKPRRFEGKNAVHPDDFPNLIKVIETIEKKDFSLVPFLRK